MVTKKDNIRFSLQETSKELSENKFITYDELLKEVDLIDMSNCDDYIALEIEYNSNYTRKELDHIADYYGISKRKKRKNQLVEEIVIFEKEPENMENVHRRKMLWYYVEEIKSDKYLSKFLILD
jgi:hypothetical protein